MGSAKMGSADRGEGAGWLAASREADARRVGRRELRTLAGAEGGAREQRSAAQAQAKAPPADPRLRGAGEASSRREVKMAQGSLRSKANKAPARKKVNRQALKLQNTKRKNAPVKRKKTQHRDPKATRLLHANIERLAAAKAVKNDGQLLRIKELAEKGKVQLQLEEKGKQKKRSRKREEIEALQIEKAQQRLQK